VDQGWRLAPHRLLRRPCHFLALDGRWAKDACHELGLRYLLSQRNHFRHFLEELIPREATLVSWLLHTHPTSYAFNGSAKSLQSAGPACGTFWAQTRHFHAFGPALRSSRWPGSPPRRPYRMSVAVTRSYERLLRPDTATVRKCSAYLTRSGFSITAMMQCTTLNRPQSSSPIVDWWAAFLSLKNQKRTDAMANALQINFALWGMIGCAAFKSVQLVQYLN